VNNVDLHPDDGCCRGHISCCRHGDGGIAWIYKQTNTSGRRDEFVEQPPVPWRPVR
jgi:hypothetical protein